MFLWSGFSSFPYSYLGSSGGADYSSMKRPYRSPGKLLNEVKLKYIQLSRFVKQHALNLLLSQDELQFQFQRDIKLSIPLPTFGK